MFSSSDENPKKRFAYGGCGRMGRVHEGGLLGWPHIQDRMGLVQDHPVLAYIVCLSALWKLDR
jgi:hypothetical protein